MNPTITTYFNSDNIENMKSPDETGEKNNPNLTEYARHTSTDTDTNDERKNMVTNDKDMNAYTVRGNQSTTSPNNKRHKQTSRVEDEEMIPANAIVIDNEEMTDIGDKELPVESPNQKRAKPAPTPRTITPYKTVHHASANRRTCERLDNNTPDRKNLSNFAYPNLTRVTVKITIPATDDPGTTTTNTINEFLDELFRVDPGSAIIPWFLVDKRKGAHNCSSDPLNTINKLKVYFNKLWNINPKEKRTLYPNLYIGHCLPLDEIKKDMNDWMYPGGHNVFRNMLQVEKTSPIGWLCYSTREMDAGALADEIHDILSCKVGLRWKAIPTGNTRSKINDSKVNALEVEVDIRDRDRIQRRLLHFYGTTTKDTSKYPNGIRLRFVKPFSESVNRREQSKINALKNRQSEFLKGIVSRSTWDIVQLDYSKAPDEPTLRQIIMEIKSKTNEKIPLFHCVDLDWKRDGYTFQYSPVLAEEAECMIYTLLPYLRHLHPTNTSLERFFTQGCRDRSEGLIYDIEKGEVIDPNFTTIEMEEGLEIVDDENLLGWDFNHISKKLVSGQENTPYREIPKEAKETGIQDFRNPHHDNDSVSTFGGTLTTKTLKKSRLYNNRGGEDASSVTPSTVTMDTLQSLETRLSKMIGRNNQDMSTKFDQLVSMLKGQTSPNLEHNNVFAKDNQPNEESNKVGEPEGNNISETRL